MKYKKIINNPQEILERGEVKKIETICGYIDELKADKIADLPLMDVFNTAVYLGLKKKFYLEKYAETYDKKNPKDNPNRKELRAVTFLYRLMPHAFGLIEREALKVSNKGVIDLADNMVHLVTQNKTGEVDERQKAIISKVEELEELLSENKE